MEESQKKKKKKKIKKEKKEKKKIKEEDNFGSSRLYAAPPLSPNSNCY
jgi:hypothetical protein